MSILAYIDPGSGSVLFQMLIAGILGGIYVARQYLQGIVYKIKARLKK